MSIRDRARRLLDRGADRSADRSAGTATRPAVGTHAAGLKDQVDRVHGADCDAADVNLAVRSQATAKVRAVRPARSAERKVARARRLRRRRLQFEQRCRQYLGSKRFRHRMVQVAELDEKGALLGHLTAWLPSVAVLVLAGAMLANDPLFVVSTVRSVLDVPRSMGFWDVRDPDVVVSLAAGAGVSTVLLGTAVMTGKALGALLFRGPVATAGHAEALEAKKRMPNGKAWIVASLGVALLGVFMWILHSLASARFEGDITAVFTGASSADKTVTWFITCLPAVVLVFETIASAPQLEHARLVARWSLSARLRERWQVRRNQWLIRADHQGVRRARRGVERLGDVIGDVGLRALDEVADSALTTGMVSVDPVAAAYRSAPPADWKPELDLSGRPSSPHLPGLPVASNAVADVLIQYAALVAEDVPELAPLATVWHDVRVNPTEFCAIEHDTTTQTCEGKKRPEPHPVDLRGIPAAEGNPAADPAA